MKLGVYSLKKVLFQGDIVSLNCQTASGEITVLPHHRPLLTILTGGVLSIVDKNNKEHYIQIGSGFLEVTDHNESRIIIT